MLRDAALASSKKENEDKVAATDMAALAIQRTIFRFAQLTQQHYALPDASRAAAAEQARLQVTRREDWERAIAARTKLDADKAAAAEAAEAAKAEQRELHRSLGAKQHAHEERARAVGLVPGRGVDWFHQREFGVAAAADRRKAEQ